MTLSSFWLSGQRAKGQCVCLGWFGIGNRVPTAQLNTAEYLRSSPEDRIPDLSLPYLHTVLYLPSHLPRDRL